MRTKLGETVYLIEAVASGVMVRRGTVVQRTERLDEATVVSVRCPGGQVYAALESEVYAPGYEYRVGEVVGNRVLTALDAAVEKPDVKFAPPPFTPGVLLGAVAGARIGGVPPSGYVEPESAPVAADALVADADDKDLW